jgi:hypothetical protein
MALLLLDPCSEVLVMALKRFNLDKKEMKGGSALFHGNYASGKTHLLGDMLRTEREFGDIAFLDIVGERGASSCANFGLGEKGYILENIEDIREFISTYRGGKLSAIGMDSLPMFVALVIREVVKENRMPVVAHSGIKNEWSEVHFMTKDLILDLKSCCNWFVATSTSDISVDPIMEKSMGKKGFITPDLPGRQAAGCAAWFDLVGYLKAEILAGGEVSRKLMVTPNNLILTRQRLPREINEDIIIPRDKGGWDAIKNAMMKAMK